MLSETPFFVLRDRNNGSCVYSEVFLLSWYKYDGSNAVTWQSCEGSNDLTRGKPMQVPDEQSLRNTRS